MRKVIELKGRGSALDSQTILRTSLWCKTLAPRADDEHAAHRERLRAALTDFRQNVLTIVRQIHHDVSGITVHDETHLDALWETADIVAGEEFELTPVEAFVFGGAVLLHDTAMAVASYDGGLAALSETLEWRDAAALEVPQGVEVSLEALRADTSAYQRVLFSALRKLHAKQAESLLDLKFQREGRQEQLVLLPSTDLKDAYGVSIGRIAHSHHWDIGAVAERLEAVRGAMPGLPPAWTLNEIKVACLLRCADAAHIDARRAPTLLYAISAPQGVSGQHWNFQNRLNAITRSADKIVFSSGQSFGQDDAASWWLAYDTIKMIDRELRASNAVLGDIGSQTFASKSVAGVETPNLMSRYVKVNGWTPVDAEVRVSDPVHLARTLGGKNLYGSGAFAPIRELLQNGADAIRARRLQQGRDDDWGLITLSLERLENSGDVWLHVDDEGVGMSERVLTGPLIDFGKSLWSSGLMEEEFPGLTSRRMKSVGKFGIGFFSIFLLGRCVKVISRKFSEAESAARVLEFAELSLRPLIRPCKIGELPNDVSTRVSVKVSGPDSGIVGHLGLNSLSRRHLKEEFTLLDNIIELIASLDVRVKINDKITGVNYEHSPHWTTVEPDIFLREILATKPKFLRDRIISTHADRVTTLEDGEGRVLGRGVFSTQSGREIGAHFVSVGGFTYNGSSFQGRFTISDSLKASIRQATGGTRLLNFIGIVEGVTEDAARRLALSNLPSGTVQDWATSQGATIPHQNFTKPALVSFSQAIAAMGGQTELPFGFVSGAFVSLNAVEGLFTEAQEIVFPMKIESYQTKFEMLTVTQLGVNYLTAPLAKNVCVFALEGEFPECLSEEERRSISNSRADRNLKLEDMMSMPWFYLFYKKINLPDDRFSAFLSFRNNFSADLIDRPTDRLSLVVRYSK